MKTDIPKDHWESSGRLGTALNSQTPTDTDFTTKETSETCATFQRARPTPLDIREEGLIQTSRPRSAGGLPTSLCNLQLSLNSPDLKPEVHSSSKWNKGFVMDPTVQPRRKTPPAHELNLRLDVGRPLVGLHHRFNTTRRQLPAWADRWRGTLYDNKTSTRWPSSPLHGEHGTTIHFYPRLNSINHLNHSGSWGFGDSNCWASALLKRRFLFPFWLRCRASSPSPQSVLLTPTRSTK